MPRRSKKKLCCLTKPVSSRGLCKDCFIRKRRSYQLLLDIAECKNVGEVLHEVWGILDDKHCWGSATNAGKAAESVELLMKDLDASSLLIGKK